MISYYDAERMIDERKRETVELQLNGQRVREAIIARDAPHFHDSTLPSQGEVRLFRSTVPHYTPRHIVRLGRVMIAW